MAVAGSEPCSRLFLVGEEQSSAASQDILLVVPSRSQVEIPLSDSSFTVFDHLATE